MNWLAYIDPEYIEQITFKRHGETRLGEQLSLITSPEDLSASKAKYLLLGIPEDIGVRANGGRPGAADGWDAFLVHFCSLPLTAQSPLDAIAVLGHINCEDLNEQSVSLDWRNPNDQKTFDQLISDLDRRVTAVIEPLIASGFVPVVIGGGHNNAYGLLKAARQAINQSMNCLNIDAHTDLRPDPYRHSGNGFHRALLDHDLKKYQIFGVHKHTLSTGIANFIDQNEYVQYYTLDRWLDTPISERNQAFKDWVAPVIDDHFGLEIDLDVIADMGSSAQSPIGLSVAEVRNAIGAIAGRDQMRYVHLCEGAPELGLYSTQVVKTISALCLDLMA